MHLLTHTLCQISALSVLLMAHPLPRIRKGYVTGVTIFRFRLTHLMAKGVCPPEGHIKQKARPQDTDFLIFHCVMLFFLFLERGQP